MGESVETITACEEHSDPLQVALISGDNQAVRSLEFKGNLFPEVCLCVSSWRASILPLSLLSACALSLFLYSVIFMSMIIELHRISWNPTGFWVLSRCLRLSLRASSI